MTNRSNLSRGIELYPLLFFNKCSPYSTNNYGIWFSSLLRLSLSFRLFDTFYNHGGQIIYISKEILELRISFLKFFIEETADLHNRTFLISNSKSIDEIISFLSNESFKSESSSLVNQLVAFNYEDYHSAFSDKFNIKDRIKEELGLYMNRWKYFVAKEMIAIDNGENRLQIINGFYVEYYRVDDQPQSKDRYFSVLEQFYKEYHPYLLNDTNLLVNYYLLQNHLRNLNEKLSGHKKSICDLVKEQLTFDNQVESMFSNLKELVRKLFIILQMIDEIINRMPLQTSNSILSFIGRLDNELQSIVLSTPLTDRISNLFIQIVQLQIEIFGLIIESILEQTESLCQYEKYSKLISNLEVIYILNSNLISSLNSNTVVELANKLFDKDRYLDTLDSSGINEAITKLSNNQISYRFNLESRLRMINLLNNSSTDIYIEQIDETDLKTNDIRTHSKRKKQKISLRKKQKTLKRLKRSPDLQAFKIGANFHCQDIQCLGFEEFHYLETELMDVNGDDKDVNSMVCMPGLDRSNDLPLNMIESARCSPLGIDESSRCSPVTLLPTRSPEIDLSEMSTPPLSPERRQSDARKHLDLQIFKSTDGYESETCDHENLIKPASFTYDSPCSNSSINLVRPARFKFDSRTHENFSSDDLALSANYNSVSYRPSKQMRLNSISSEYGFESS